VSKRLYPKAPKEIVTLQRDALRGFQYSALLKYYNIVQ